MEDKPKLGHYAAKLLDRLRCDHDKLCREIDNSEEGRTSGGFRYFTEPSGKRVDIKSAQRLIELGLVRPCNDGLLPGHDQVFEIVA